jgi:hypothetical protein
MRTVILIAVLLSAFRQEGSQPYAGTWIAELAGKAYVRLELNATKGTLAGNISLADIHVDSRGVVNRVTSAPREVTPIFDITLRDSTLSFSRKDGDDTDHFEMRLVGDAAELRFVPTEADRRELAGEGIPTPKPFPIKRIAP